MLRSNLVTVAHITSLTSFSLATAMLLPMAVDLRDNDANWQAFLMSAVLVGSLAALTWMATRGRLAPFSTRTGFLTVNALWLSSVIIASLPIYLSDQGLGVADAAFEGVSGLTTTGATVLTGLDTVSRGLLMWRSLLEWIGGIGIIAMGILIFPMLRVGGMQVFRMESSHQSDRPVATFASFASYLLAVYLVLTALCIAGYLLAGMSMFDAFNHAMTTVSTGGFSTHDASMGHFGDRVHIVAIVFMIAGAMPFVSIMRALVARDLRKAYDPQIPVLLGILMVFAILFTTTALIETDHPATTVVVDAVFTMVSIVTGTGYATTDYAKWGTFATALVLLAMFMGGATGSTTGGIKTYRFMVLFQVLRNSLKELLYPNGVFTTLYEKRKLGDNAVRSVFLFFAVFCVLLMLLTAALAATGLGLPTAFSGALSALANVGPGVGEQIGPAGNYSGFSDAAKWLMALGMLLGRLEIMTVLVLVTPLFWRG